MCIRAPIKPDGEPQNKAALVARYLRYFVLVTKHGTYIDGFAGSQETGKPETWAAKLVVDTRPDWMRHFFLFEKDRSKIAALESLRVGQAKHRRFTIQSGDCNQLIPELLNAGSVRQKDATFCLLDQRTFECSWSTLEALARYKQSGHKIELFYFLPNSWFDRALAGLTRNERATLQRWWGRNDWADLKTMSEQDRLHAFLGRFHTELGYAHVKPWPIYEKEGGRGHLMYYMLHATDHDDAPILMSRAYRKVLDVADPVEQLTLEIILQEEDSQLA